MIDVQSYANSAINIINQDILITIRQSIGYQIPDNNGRRQEPLYADPITGFSNIQAVTNEDLMQIDGLNIQGTYKVLYLKGQLFAVVRPEIKGGDLVEFNNQQWLVNQILERWKTWCKVAICLQLP